MKGAQNCSHLIRSLVLKVQPFKCLDISQNEAFFIGTAPGQSTVGRQVHFGFWIHWIVLILMANNQERICLCLYYFKSAIISHRKYTNYVCDKK